MTKVKNTNRFYVRIGSVSIEPSTQELVRMLQSGGVYHFEVTSLPGTSLADIDLLRLRIYCERFRRVDVPEWEFFAVRELVVNAFCHRDWSVSGQKIRLSLFDDRLEIFSPGALPNNLSLANALAGVSYYRNPNISQLCKDYELAEKAGRGLQKIFKTFHERNLPPPEIVNDPTFFQVVLKRDG